jgi:hypothetical protein
LSCGPSAPPKPPAWRLRNELKDGLYYTTGTIFTADGGGPSGRAVPQAARRACEISEVSALPPLLGTCFRILASSGRKIGGVSYRLYKFLNTNLGTWFLTTVVVGLAVFIYSERNQCIQSRDSDNYIDQKNQFELLSMYGEFISLTANATTKQDLQQVMKELGPHRSSYKFSDNKDKTASQMIWEHIVFVNRWGGTARLYWNGDTEYKVEQLWLSVEDFVRSNSDDKTKITEFSRLATDLASNGPATALNSPKFNDLQLQFVVSHKLWQAMTPSCGFWTILRGTFRKIDSVAHY